jgi:hypothetical protein
MGYKAYFSPTHSELCGESEEKNKGSNLMLDIIDCNNSFRNCVLWLRKSSYLATSKSWTQCLGDNQLKEHQLKITKVDYSWIPGKPESFTARMNHRVSLCWRTNITQALDCCACPRTDVPELWKGQCSDKVTWRRPWGGELNCGCRSAGVTHGRRLPRSPWCPMSKSSHGWEW